MHELGNVQNVVNPYAVFNPWDTQETQSTSGSSRFHIYDDAAAAAVNPWAVFNPWDAEGTQPTSESSKFPVYSDAGKIVEWLREEIISINSFDGFMLGVHDKIEQFSRHTQFGLEQVLDVEQNIAELHESLEIYKFTLQQIRAEALKALRCQGNLGPQRVLQFLRESISEPETVEQGDEEHAVTILEQNK